METSDVMKLKFDEIKNSCAVLVELNDWFNKTPFEEIVSAFNDLGKLCDFKDIISIPIESTEIDLDKLDRLLDYIEQKRKEI